MGILREIVTKYARSPVERVPEQGALCEQVGLDSLAMVMALAEIEDRLRIRFPVERVGNLRELSFQELKSLVLDSVSAGNGHA